MGIWPPFRGGRQQRDCQFDSHKGPFIMALPFTYSSVNPKSFWEPCRRSIIVVFYVQTNRGTVLFFYLCGIDSFWLPCSSPGCTYGKSTNTSGSSILCKLFNDLLLWHNYTDFLFRSPGKIQWKWYNGGHIAVVVAILLFTQLSKKQV